MVAPETVLYDPIKSADRVILARDRDQKLICFSPAPKRSNSVWIGNLPKALKHLDMSRENPPSSDLTRMEFSIRRALESVSVTEDLPGMAPATFCGMCVTQNCSSLRDETLAQHRNNKEKMVIGRMFAISAESLDFAKSTTLANIIQEGNPKALLALKSRIMASSRLSLMFLSSGCEKPQIPLAVCGFVLEIATRHSSSD